MPNNSTNTSNPEGNLNLKDTVYVSNTASPPPIQQNS